MRYLSVCSGIEAASVAWHDLGWQPIGFSEIEKFPSQVLETRFPGVRNYGDMTRFKEWDIERGAIDILVGGTPCQAFSVAGLRRGLEDPRGNLALTFVAMVDWYRPEWVVWENVPGVLSSNGGRDFGAFLGALGQLGYGWCYRILDAQYFGVAQRRRRVFVVAHSSGDPRRAAEVLFEPESLRRDPPPSRETGEGFAGDVVSGTVSRKWAKGTGGPAGDKCYNLTLAPAVYESHPNDSRVTGPVEQCPTVAARRGTGGNNTPLVQQPMAMRESGQGYWMQDEVIGTIRAEGENRPSRPSNVVAVQQPMCLMDQGGSVMQVNTDGTTGTLRRETHGHEPVVVVQQPMAFSISPGVNRGKQTTDDLFVAQQETSRTLDTQGANPERHQGGTVIVQQPMAFTHSGYSNQPAWITGDRTDCLSAGGHSDTSHQGIGIIESVQQPMEMHTVSESGDVSSTLRTGGNDHADVYNVVAVQQPMAIPLQDCREMDKRQNGLGIGNQGDPAYTLDRMATQGVAVQQPMAFAQNQLGEVRTNAEIMGTLNTNQNASGRNTPMVQQAMAVRRLTPVECERLQGFPDGWTDIKPGGRDTPDSPRYKALGNSMAVPVMAWIGRRINMAVQ